MTNELWKLGNGSTPDGRLIVDQDDKVIASVYGDTEDQARERAALIVELHNNQGAITRHRLPRSKS